MSEIEMKKYIIILGLTLFIGIIHCKAQSFCDSLYIKGYERWNSSESDSMSYYFSRLVKECPDSRKLNCAREYLIMSGFYEKTEDDLQLDSLSKVVYEEFLDPRMRMPFFIAVDSLYSEYYQIDRIQNENFFEYLAIGDTLKALEYSERVLREGIRKSDCPGQFLYYTALYRSFLLAKINSSDKALKTLELIGNEIPFAVQYSSRHWFNANQWYRFVKGFVYAKSGQVDSTLKYLDYYLFQPERYYPFANSVPYKQLQSLLAELIINSMDEKQVVEWLNNLESNSFFSEKKEIIEYIDMQSICADCELELLNRKLIVFKVCYEYYYNRSEYYRRGEYYSEEHCNNLVNNSPLVNRMRELKSKEER